MAKAATKKAPTKSEVYTAIAEKTELSRKQVASVFEELNNIVKKSLKTHGGFTLPGIAKLVVRKKPATKGGMRPNPFKPGEMMEVKPKPASKKVSIRPIKALKEAVA
jgi:DNA-binding protein HU-beta